MAAINCYCYYWLYIHVCYWLGICYRGGDLVAIKNPHICNLGI